MTGNDPRCPQCGGRPIAVFATGVAVCDSCDVRWDVESEETLVAFVGDGLRELVAEADDRESWLSVPGVDWDADNEGVLEIGFRGETGPFIANGEWEGGVGLQVHSHYNETVSLYGNTEDDDYGIEVSLTPEGAERLARQLAVAAHAARERDGSDVRT